MRPDLRDQQKPEAGGNNKPKTEASPLSEAVIVYSTYPNAAEAEAIAAAMVDARLVACANIFPAMTSIYHWNGARQRDSEVAVVMKTRSSLAARVALEIKTRHSYGTPAIVVLPIIDGSAEYLSWIMAETAAAAGATDHAS